MSLLDTEALKAEALSRVQTAIERENQAVRVDFNALRVFGSVCCLKIYLHISEIRIWYGEPEANGNTGIECLKTSGIFQGRPEDLPAQRTGVASHSLRPGYQWNSG